MYCCGKTNKRTKQQLSIGYNSRSPDFRKFWKVPFNSPLHGWKCPENQTGIFGSHGKRSEYMLIFRDDFSAFHPCSTSTLTNANLNLHVIRGTTRRKWSRAWINFPEALGKIELGLKVEKVLVIKYIHQAHLYVFLCFFILALEL